MCVKPGNLILQFAIVAKIEKIYCNYPQKNIKYHRYGVNY